MKKYLVIGISLLSLSIANNASSMGDKPSQSGEKVKAEIALKGKELSKKMVNKVSEMSMKLHSDYQMGLITNTNKSVEEAFNEFVEWLKNELGESMALPDLERLKASVVIVFTHACSSDHDAYKNAWSYFLQQVMRLSLAIVGMSVAGPVGAPIGMVVGSILGKYVGLYAGSAIHKAACGGGGIMMIQSLANAASERIDSIDPYKDAEWVEFAKVVNK